MGEGRMRVRAATNFIAGGLIERLRAKNVRGEVTEEELRLFLDNPEVVLMAADELAMAWNVARKIAGHQDRAEILRDIAWVTKDPEALTRAEKNWSTLPNVHPATRGEIAGFLVSTYIAFGMVKEARELVGSIPDPHKQIMSLHFLYDATHVLTYIEDMRKLAERANPESAVLCLNEIALASKQPKDLERAENAWIAHRGLLRQEQVGRRRVPHIIVLLEMEEIDRAREVTDSIDALDARIQARALLVQHTRNESDLQRLTWELREHEVRRIKTLRWIVEGCLACDKPELARVYASARVQPAERCILFGCISMAHGGNEEDLRIAIRAERSVVARDVAEIGARLQLVHALAHRAHHREAKMVAIRINAPVPRTNAYLVIHRATVGGDPLPFEMDRW